MTINDEFGFSQSILYPYSVRQLFCKMAGTQVYGKKDLKLK